MTLNLIDKQILFKCSFGIFYFITKTSLLLYFRRKWYYTSKKRKQQMFKLI